MFTTVLLTEKALSDHDVRRVAHLHDPEPVHVHVVVPSHDDRSELAEAVDDIARADFADVLHDEDAGRTPSQLASAAEREVEASIAALLSAGVAQVDGEVVTEGELADGSSGHTGNRARDHLANERTYLSWLRTSLGVLALAAAVARFGAGRGHQDGSAVAVLGLLGVFLLGLGTRRYYQVAADLEQGRFSFSRRTPLLVAVVVVTVAVVLLPLLL